MSFSKILKDLREEKGYTRTYVAEQCGVTTQCISTLELGTRSPTGSTLAVLADFFGCSIDYLMGRETNDDALTFAPPSAPSLPADEQELLEAFRKLNAKNKLHVKIYAQLRLEEQSSPTTYPRKA